MRVRTIENVRDLRRHFGLQYDGLLLESDLDLIENDCDYYERKRRDAETLCTLAANVSGKVLDLGTSYGRSAFKLASNLACHDKVYTVNLLPEQYDNQGVLITHLIQKDEIGSFYRQFNLVNVQQIFANTLTWDIPPEIDDLALVFIDANHDTEFVHQDTKKIYDRVRSGGFILWHDFNPALRQTHHWIDAVMTGVERFLADFRLNVEIAHLKDSWVGVLKKP